MSEERCALCTSPLSCVQKPQAQKSRACVIADYSCRQLASWTCWIEIVSRCSPSFWNLHHLAAVESLCQLVLQVIKKKVKREEVAQLKTYREHVVLAWNLGSDKCGTNIEFLQNLDHFQGNSWFLLGSNADQHGDTMRHPCVDILQAANRSQRGRLCGRIGKRILPVCIRATLSCLFVECFGGRTLYKHQVVKCRSASCYILQRVPVSCSFALTGTGSCLAQRGAKAMKCMKFTNHHESMYESRESVLCPFYFICPSLVTTTKNSVVPRWREPCWTSSVSSGHGCDPWPQRAMGPPLEFSPGYEEIRTRALHKVDKKLEFHII